MKGIKNLVVGIILGSLLGWTLGFLRFPYIEQNFSFLLGFTSCLALVLISLLLLFMWNKNAMLLRLISKNPKAEQAVKTHSLLSGMASTFIILGVLAIGMLIFRQNRLNEEQFRLQNEKITQQLLLLESSRHSNVNVLMDNLFDRIDEELKESPGRTLSDETIDRIVALNYSFQPYQYMKGDSLNNKKLSPERGQLLVLFSSLKLDSSSFHKIKSRTSFLGADLEGVDLSGIDLSGADLREANLRNAVLKDIDLSQADLRKADLWGSDLEKANLSKADLQNAVFDWANLIASDMSGAVLNGAKFRSAKLTRANLNNTTTTWTNLSGAFLNGAKLMESDLTWTNLRNANLSNAQLKNAKMRVTNLIGINMSQANLEGVDLTGSIILEENWMDKLDEWQVEGAEEIKREFDIVIDKSGLYDFRIGKAPKN